MKYLCLAYGAEKDWRALSRDAQTELLAQDEVLRERGDYMAAVSTDVTMVRVRDGKVDVADQPFTSSRVPLAGFGIIEAESLEQAIELVKDTPCVRAKGAVELRPLLDLATNNAGT